MWIIYQAYFELGLRSKSRLSSNGRVSGNAVFFSGSLCEMLQNPLYLGEIRHKQISYPGQHDAIVQKELCDAVKRRLNANRPAEECTATFWNSAG